MAHKTLIGGTAYEIGGGRTLVGGTAYSIDKGKTLVGGTAYEIGLSNFPSVGTPLNDFTWEEIRMVSDAGLAAEYFTVGDIKTIVLNGTAGATAFSGLSVDVFIIGIDHNSTKEGANRIHFQIGKIGTAGICLCDSKLSTNSTTDGNFIMNTSNINTGGWNASYMRKTLLGNDSAPTSPSANTLLSCLPSDLRTVMKSVTKYSDNTGGGTEKASSVTATTDYLWLLAECEVHGSDTRCNKYEANSQMQYDYYKNGGSKSKYRHDKTTTSTRWWTRSANSGSTAGFCSVNESGVATYAGSKFSWGIAPAFAV